MDGATFAGAFGLTLDSDGPFGTLECALTGLFICVARGAGGTCNGFLLFLLGDLPPPLGFFAAAAARLACICARLVAAACWRVAAAVCRACRALVRSLALLMIAPARPASPDCAAVSAARPE